MENDIIVGYKVWKNIFFCVRLRSTISYKSILLGTEFLRFLRHGCHIFSSLVPPCPLPFSYNACPSVFFRVGLNIKNWYWPEPVRYMIFRLFMNKHIQTVLVSFGKIPSAPHKVKV